MCNPELYEKWVKAIEEHQKFDHNKINYNVCIKHFHTTDLEIRGKKQFLKKDTVPTIFGETVENEVADSDINQCSECPECTNLKSK